jgi:hypothetical protein
MIQSLQLSQYMQNKKSSPLKKIFIGLLILLLIGSGMVWYIFTEKFSDTVKQKADFYVNANGFIKEFQQNDHLANNKYSEKIVVVDGIINEIETADTTANIKFIDTASGDYVIFAFQQQHLAEAKKLQEGQRVSIKGSCSGGTYSEILGIKYISFKRAALNY